MDRRFVRVNNADQVNLATKLYIKIAGSSVTTSSSVAGLSIGANFCTIKNDGANAITITYNRPFIRAPEVASSTVYTTNCKLDTIVPSTTGLTFVTVKADSASTGVNNANIYLTLDCFESVDLV